MTTKPLRLTPEFLKASTVAFFPASAGEARYIQSRLFALGARWVNSGRGYVDAEPCLRLGMVVSKGIIYTFAEDSDTHAIVCDVRNLSDHLDAPSLALQQRVDALEKQVAQLSESLTPRALVKPQKGPQP